MSDAGELNRRLVYRCRVFDVYEGDVRLPNGRIFKQSWIDHRPCIAVVPVNPEGNVVLIRQFRHGIRDVVLEIPGGMIDGDEPPEAAAARELREETGYVAQRIRPLARVLPNPAVQNNYLYLFAAEGCRNTGHAEPDAFECIDVVERPMDDIPSLICRGEICHAMVIAAFAFMGLVPKA